MKKWFPVLVGFVTGIGFAGWTVLQNPRPTICIFFQAPLMLLFEYLDRHTRPLGLAALAVVIPLWFIYWAFLGTLAGFLPRLLVCLFGVLRRYGGTQHELDKQSKREMTFCVSVGLIILIVILTCILHSHFSQKPNGFPVYYQGP